MQKITLAKTAGFCFGVNRAMNLLEQLVKDGKKVCTLGPIIHNPQVISYFENLGVRIVDRPDECVPGGTLVIRTHGITKDLLSDVKNNGEEYCNATCPFVTKIHKIISGHSAKENATLIAGDKSHPEVIGIRSYCTGESFVFNSEEELDEIIKNNPDLKEKDIILVSQTTFSTKIFEKCVKKIKLVYTNAVIFDTICSATEERQAEAASLSLTNDAMVIVGGRQSSNTAKLKSVCESNCPTFLIETADELKNIDFKAFHSVAVTAGASTPDSIIKEVLNTMSENLENKTTSVEKEEPVISSAENFADMVEEYIDSSSDQKVTGIVVSVSPTEIQVEIAGRKHTGYIPLDEYTSDPTVDPQNEVKIGDKLDLIIMKTNDMEGTMMLSKRRYDAVKAWDALSESTDETAEGKVTAVVGDGKGLFVQYGAIRVFIPASLAKSNRSDSLEDMVKKTVRFKIIEVDKKRKRVVGSIKAAMKDIRREAEEAFWAQAEEGQVYHGTVRSLTSYGAFVDLGGVDGMVHISELSWTRIKHPSDVVNVGDTVEVYIKALDRENKKISLGYKKVEDNPWEILRRDYPVGSECDATVVGLTSFGAFANILPGIDGLVHISEIAYEHIGNPSEVLKVGDKIKVKILEVDFDKKRVSLSRKALLEDPVIDTAEDAAPVAIEDIEAEEASEEATEAKPEETPEATEEVKSEAVSEAEAEDKAVSAEEKTGE